MKKRKIGILTQPLHTNYGGLLQCYALQKVLRDMGHEVKTIRLNNKISYARYYLSILKQIVCKYLLFKQGVKVLMHKPTPKQKNIISQYTEEFIKDHIVTLDVNGISISSSLASNFDFNTYIVGSDQTWRPSYSPYLPNYFFDFISDSNNIRKVSYAASFGVDTWEFSQSQTNLAKKLVKDFDLITVREDSAVELCKNHLAVHAEQVLDPTLLLLKDDYINLIGELTPINSSENLYVYLLDKNELKCSIVDYVSKFLKLKPFEVMPVSIPTGESKISDINKCVYPSVQRWLRGFIDADFIITDSFHGTVFSIIFNKQFICIPNENRGITRFSSILGLLNLESRLVNSVEGVEYIISDKIDFHRVNLALVKFRERSISLLKSAI